MRLTWLWGQRFSRRLMLLALLSAVAPMTAVAVAVHIFSRQLPVETQRVLAEGRDLEWQRSEEAIRGRIEFAIQQKARDVALQLSLYVEAHPAATLDELKQDRAFRELALQPVGKTGYTALHDCRTTIVHFHPSPKIVGLPMKDTEQQFPELCRLFQSVVDGSEAGGYYTWRAPDGRTVEKYLHLTPLRTTTADGARLCVAATTTVSEFTEPLHAAQEVAVDTTANLNAVIRGLLIRSRNTVFVVMALGLVGVLAVSYLGGRHLSKIVTQLREATQRINQGDYDVRVSSPMLGEVDELAHDFNRMVSNLSETTVKKDQLERSERRLSQVNANLQAQIMQRHRVEAELRHANERMIDALNRERRSSLQLQAAMEQLEAAMQQLEAASRDAMAANHAKSEFLANMSHEIRTPLTAILGFADVLAESITDDEQKTAIQTIQRSGQHLLQLINDILDLSKIEAGYMEPDYADCSIADIIEETVGMVEHRAAEKGLTLVLMHEAALPETIRTDPTRVRQALANLLGNAVKFTDRGRVDVITRLLEDGSRPMLEIRIRDTGIGIPSDKLQVIFEPFSQADNSTTRKYGGTGLGLAVTGRIVELLGGRIDVESRLGVGSTFTLQIPTGPLKDIKRIVPKRQGASAPKSDQVAPEHRRLDCEVLLVEDGPDNQRLIKAILTKAGARVDIADNGETGMAKALAGHYDVVLMDMQMPVMDGYEATRRLRADGYDRPILALTAHAMEGDADRCLQAGCDAYLSKPVNKPRLIQAIAEWLGRTSDRRDDADSHDDGCPNLSATAVSLGIPGLSNPSHEPNTAMALEQFVESLPGRLEEVWRAWHDLDSDQLNDLVRRLDDDSKTHGVTDLTATLSSIELANREAMSERVLDDLDRLKALIADMTPQPASPETQSDRT